jgi:hypothetical protein
VWTFLVKLCADELSSQIDAVRIIFKRIVVKLALNLEKMLEKNLISKLAFIYNAVDVDNSKKYLSSSSNKLLNLIINESI